MTIYFIGFVITMLALSFMDELPKADSQEDLFCRSVAIVLLSAFWPITWGIILVMRITNIKDKEADKNG